MGTLYENIKSLCDKKGIKPGKMCVDVGISKGLISDLKAGRKKSVQIETAQKIASYFDVSVDQLIGDQAYLSALDDALFAAVDMIEEAEKGKKKPASQTASGLHRNGYDQLSPENKSVIDSLIEKLLKSQSGE